jgi:hypothetical protein
MCIETIPVMSGGAMTELTTIVNHDSVSHPRF